LGGSKNKNETRNFNPVPLIAACTGHSAADVARYPRLPTPGTDGQVGIGRANVLRSIKRGYEI